LRVLLTGRNGQVGWELERALSVLGEVAAFDRDGLDLAKPDQIVARIREVKPEVIVNAAAYTAVDRAESEPDLAFAINATAARILAEEAKKLGALLVHYSTDYVFDGNERQPYSELDEPNPLNVYGRTKLEGENAVRQAGGWYLILRSSWIYSSRGDNFLRTILRLAKERDELRIVNDQWGTPTWARDIATATGAVLAQALEQEAEPGIFHLTSQGEMTWCGFAQEILRMADIPISVRAIPTSAYPTPARRPAYSVLTSDKARQTFGVVLPDWRDGLASCFRELKAGH